MTTRMIFALLTMLTQLSGCEARMLPSRAMTVNLSVTQVTSQDIAEYLQQKLLSMNFYREGADGYDVLTRQENSLHFARNDGVFVSIALDQPDAAYIRVGDHGYEFSSRANEVFGVLYIELDKVWPNAVTKEPAATSQNR